MLNGRLVIVCAVCGFVALAVGGEVLYNGIILPEKWPHQSQQPCADSRTLS